jgi:hypothetical protein
MRKPILLATALPAALAAAALAATLGTGSSHREAPLTSLDPAADDTDVYAYTARDAPGSLTVVANWIPLEDPAGGPNFYRFDDRARYYINVDNTGDGRWDVRYRFRFRTRVGNPNSFLYALPGVSSITDSKLNVKQFYSVDRLRYRRGRLLSARRLASNLRVAPNNVGPKTIPNYDAVAAQAVSSLSGGGKVFAGQREDPFFVDLGATFDAINIRNGTGASGGGKDDVAGYGVHAIVLQVPERAVTRDGRPVSAPNARNAVIGVWASTERRRLQVSGNEGRSSGRYVQVSRLGNPLVNEVIIPLGQKDRFNATQPSDDGENFGAYVVKPELAAVLNLLFPGLNIPEDNRTDIVQALLTGVPGLTQIRPGAPPTDTLKLNLGVPPAAAENRFGVIGGDNAGFPNGRRLADDVVDIELRVIGGFLKGNKLPLGDGADRNDVAFPAAFPYVGSAPPGFDSDPKRLEAPHPPTSADTPSR